MKDVHRTHNFKPEGGTKSSLRTSCKMLASKKKKKSLGSTSSGYFLAVVI